MPAWDQSKLALLLQARDDAVKQRLVLNTCMPVVEEVLRAGAPASLNFTLHDDQHGFRVAEMAYRLAEDAVSHLSSLELTMLLLSCYCHDIGMSPRRQKVKNHHSWLLTGDPSTLSAGERDQFQAWLDTNRSGLTPPVEPLGITSLGLLVADDALAYYSRSRHNDWSEEFIREEIAPLSASLYPGWIDDLVVLCRSHHDGLVELRQDKFNAKYVGSPAQPLNLRYLACVLRVADVLEFAPERTPAVILKNRDIVASSRIFWYKDHAISFQIDATSHHMRLAAQTPNAAIHRAVLETVEWVNAELALVAALQQEGLLASGFLADSLRAFYKWPWPSRLITDIREVPGSFTYIEGGFRPDTQKVLAILSGTALYENVFAAVRELVQNSFDAIREQIAYSRLQLADPLDKAAVDSIASLHNVTFSIVEDGDRLLLICEDNGVGMTRSIIERHMLVSGSGIRGETRRLERAAQNAGFLVERTGRFGIGVLSYFMIANSVKLLTRRSQEGGDIDGCAWSFVIDGLDGFGELRTASRASRGTTVTLDIKPDIVGSDTNAFSARLEAYVLETFRWVPCKLHLKREVGGLHQRSVGPGWTHSPDDASEPLVSQMLPRVSVGTRLITHEEERRRKAESLDAGRMVSGARASLRWTPPEEAALSGGVGNLRGSVPYFDFAGGSSSLFYKGMTEELEFEWGENQVKSPRVKNWSSLHGIAIESVIKQRDCLIDLDLRKDFAIRANRTKLVSPLSSALLSEVGKFRAALWNSFLESSKDSPFNEVNIAYARLPSADTRKYLRDEPAWPLRGYGDKLTKVQPLTYPFIVIGRLSFYDWANYHSKVPDGCPEAIPLMRENVEGALTFAQLYGGGELILHAVSLDRMPMVGLSFASSKQLRKIDGTVSSCMATFPPSFAHVVCARLPERTIFNATHSLVKRASAFPVGHRRAPTVESIDEAISKLLEPAQALAFVVKALEWSRETWRWVQENRQREMQAIFSLANVPNEPLSILPSEVYSDRGYLIRVDQAVFGNDDPSEGIPAVAPSDVFSLDDKGGRH